VQLERRGRPTVLVGTEPFRPLAATAAAARGMPDLPTVTVAHPIGGVDPKLVRDRADGIVDAVLAALTTAPAAAATAPRGAAGRMTVADDLEAFQELAVARGWSDGLPVLPPTPARVDRLLAAAGAPPDAVVGTLAPAMRAATVETVAVNAALAGALPEHMPVIVAALRAVSDPRFNLNAVQTTTHPCTPLVIVNGPVAARLGIGGGANALGNGHRANAVIGRAVRLVLQNAGGAVPGETDRATLGHPGKFTYCVAENEAASPWEPLHVERGFRAGESCVTVCGGDAPHNVNDHGSTTAAGLVGTLAGVLGTPGSNNVYLGGEPLVVLGPEHARTIADSGWTKADLKRALWERARVRLHVFSAENLARFALIDPARFTNRPPGAEVAQAQRAEDLMVIVAGGPGKHSAIVPTFGATRAVTVRVEG
jgi:hypothetical protein